MPSKDLLQREQDAFDTRREALLSEHRGEFVVFKNEKVIDFFSTFEEAYAAALQRFGLDAVFLISPVEPKSTHPVSISWDLGVMYAD